MLAISSRYEGELYLITSLGQHGNITYKPLASYLFTSCFEPVPSSLFPDCRSVIPHCASFQKNLKK